MVFIETPIFTADVCALLSDEEYSALQQHLVAMPNAGDVIAGTGGLRKIRWTVAGRSKRGGTRVIYYHVVAQAQIRMILIYRKGDQGRPDAEREDGIAENQCGVVTLDKKLFKRLVESMGQMDEIVRGVRAPSREFYVDAAKVKEIRAITGLSQPKFAKLLHVDVGTLRNWEQGRREPTGPAQALLRAIKKNPQAVLKALAA
jgi:putative transcriptional regulator